MTGLLLVVTLAWGMPGVVVGNVAGQQIFEASCAGCHATGAAGAPRLGSPADWRTRTPQGLDALVQTVMSGRGAMPPKGGNPSLDERQVRAATEYLVAEVSESSTPQPDAQLTPERKRLAAALDRYIDRPEAAQPPPVAEAQAPAPVNRDASVLPKKQVLAKAPVPQRKPVNAFNRLMQPPSKRNPPPMRDGIHDPVNDGTTLLQAPKEAFDVMPKANSGNRVDWVKAMDSGDIQPRYDLLDPDKQPVVLDLNIVREVKGSMPDVVYPHKQHTEWLDCSNCHPSIFIPKKGANNISMASILLGEQCGVCHGKVAFPVAECRKCHSKNKARD
jgi:c(7)-type cytochrome triheme protein